MREVEKQGVKKKWWYVLLSDGVDLRMCDEMCRFNVEFQLGVDALQIVILKEFIDHR